MRSLPSFPLLVDAIDSYFKEQKPNLEEYAKFWIQREKVEIISQIDPLHGQIVAEVNGAFDGMALSIRLPDSTVPGEITINNKKVDAASRRIGGVWWVYPVLPDVAQCRVIVGYIEEQISEGT